MNPSKRPNRYATEHRWNANKFGGELGQESSKGRISDQDGVMVGSHVCAPNPSPWRWPHKSGLRGQTMGLTKEYARAHCDRREAGRDELR